MNTVTRFEVGLDPYIKLLKKRIDAIRGQHLIYIVMFMYILTFAQKFLGAFFLFI